LSAEQAFRLEDLPCPACGHTIKVRVPFIFCYVACPSCKRVSERDEKTGEISVYKAFNKKNTKYHQEPLIDIRTFATIKGTRYYVAGYIEFKERNKTYKWAEYILYNAAGETVFLSEYKNCYNLIRRADGANFEELSEDEIKYDGEIFPIYNKYKIDVQRVRGEVPYELFRDTQAVEYLSAPEIIITHEYSDGGKNYFLGRYIGKRELRKAFGREIPYAEVVAPTKPIFGGLTRRGVLLTFGCFIIACYLAQTLVWNIYPATEKFKSQYSVHRDTNNVVTPAEWVSPTITLEGTASNLYVKYSASNLSNDWYEGYVTLVNEINNKEATAFFNAEYYSGYDDGYWSEGSSEAAVMFSNLGPGRYHLVSSFELSPSANSNTFYVSATEDERMESNFWYTVLLAGIPTLIVLVAEWIHGINRWSDSDYSPYA
jgi:hypothetical protein